MGCSASVIPDAQRDVAQSKGRRSSHTNGRDPSAEKAYRSSRQDKDDGKKDKILPRQNPLANRSVNNKQQGTPLDLKFSLKSNLSELNKSPNCILLKASDSVVDIKHGNGNDLAAKESCNNLQKSVSLSDTCSISTGSSALSSSATVSFNEALQVVLAELQNHSSNKLTISSNEMQYLQHISSAMKTVTSSVQHHQHTVQSSWKSLEQKGLLERFAHKMYDEMLSNSPHLRVFFYGINLDAQSRALIKMLCSAVHIYDSPQDMVSILTQSGARHRGYGVTSEMFNEMKTAFMKTFPLFVDRDVFEATEREWIKFWNLVISLLQYGNITPEGNRYGKMYDEQNLNKLQHDMALIKTRQSALGGRHAFSDIMLYKAAELISDFSRFERAKSSVVITRLFEVVSHVVEHFGDKEYTETYLHEFGSEHVADGLTLKDLSDFSEPFLYACRHFLENEWNIAMEVHFLALFKYTVDNLYAGFNKVKSVRCSSRASRDMSHDYEVDAWSETYSTASEDTGDSSATFCMLFISVESSDELWSRNADTMRTAMLKYHKILRRLMNLTNAYEVKKIGDSCALATKNVYDAVRLALALQLELMRASPIAPGFAMLECTEGGGEAAAWSDTTLRVRVSIECCTEDSMTYDLVHNHYDYYCTSIERCMRIESVACGGQILMSRPTYDKLLKTAEYRSTPCPTYLRGLHESDQKTSSDDAGLEKFVAVSDIGKFTIHGLGEPLHLISMVPSCLSGRTFYSNEQRPK